MHTARWDHDHELAGKRVGVIGTGASAVQVVPAIAPEVERLTVFQRTPIWCLPKPDARARRRRPLGRCRDSPARRLASRVASAGLRRARPSRCPPTSTAWCRSPSAARGSAGSSCASRSSDPEVREQADAPLRARLQAARLLERVPATFNRENVALETAGDRRDRRPAGVRTARRRRARARRARPRDGLQGLRAGQHAALPGPGRGRRSTSRDGGMRTASRPTRGSASPASRTCSRSSARTATTAPPTSS